MVSKDVHFSTPICRTCGAKHSRDKTTGLCRRCGYDPTVRPSVTVRIARKFKGAPKPISTKDRKTRRAELRSMRATTGRKKYKHGRRGVLR